MTKTRCHNGTLPFGDYGGVHADDGGYVQAFMPFFMIFIIGLDTSTIPRSVEPLCWRWIVSPPASRSRRSPICPTYGPLSMSKRCALFRSRIVCSTPSPHDCSPAGCLFPSNIEAFSGTDVDDGVPLGKGALVNPHISELTIAAHLELEGQHDEGKVVGIR